MFRIIPVLLLMVLACPAGAQSVSPAPSRYAPVDPGALMDTTRQGGILSRDGEHKLSQGGGRELGLLVPDVEGNYVYVPGGRRQEWDADYVNAQEIKLKARELADQMLETWPNGGLTGVVAMPASFVNLNDFEETSPLGRYMAEAMFYEFNNRGVATREYRTNGRIHFNETGEFALTHSLPDIRLEGSTMALLTGTFHRDKDAVFINARLIRASDGLVLRAGQLVLAMNPIIERMSVPGPKPVRHPFAREDGQRTGLRIVQGRR